MNLRKLRFWVTTAFLWAAFSLCCLGIMLDGSKPW